MVYKALVKSILSYGIVARGETCKSGLNKLQISQNHIFYIL